MLMHHLEREYSMELLLSYIELDQFQKYVVQIADDYLKTHLCGPGALAPNRSTLTAGTPSAPKLESIPEGVSDQMTVVVTPATPALCGEIKNPYAQYPVMRHSDLQHIPDLSLDIMQSMPNVPTSEILEKMCSLSTSRITVDQKTLRDVKKKAHLLYNKYIKCGSPFEVNVDYATRTALRNKLDDRETLLRDETLRLTDLIQMFDAVKMTMKRLLSSSFGRMKTSLEWSTIMAVLKE